METNAANPAGATPPVAGGVSATAYNHPLLQAQVVAKPGCKCGKLRPPRKLHTLVGLWLALFVSVHFLICLTGLDARNYEGTVSLVRRSLAYLPGAVLRPGWKAALLPSALERAGDAGVSSPPCGKHA